MMSITDSSRAPTPQRGPSTTPLPTFTRRLTNRATRAPAESQASHDSLIDSQKASNAAVSAGMNPSPTRRRWRIREERLTASKRQAAL